MLLVPRGHQDRLISLCLLECQRYSFAQISRAPSTLSCVRVCVILYFYPATPLHAAQRAIAAAPPLPKQRRWLFLYTFFPCARTGLTGHSGPPSPPTVKKDKRKKKSPPQKPPKGKDTKKVHSRAGLGPPPLRSRPPPCPPGAFSLYPRTPPLWCAKTPTRRPWRPSSNGPRTSPPHTPLAASP